MAKDFTGAIRFPAGPETVFAAQSDPEYVVWKHENMAARDVTVDVTASSARTVISSTRKLPAELPAAAQRFVGDSITITEVHSWGSPDDDGSRAGTVTASFPGAPMSVDGTLALRPEGDGTVLEIAVTARASVPLVGGKLEQLVGEQLMRALAKEEQLAAEWFAP